MNDATKEIMATYDMDQLKDIADHGCQSGVCSQHIYYADTIKFYAKHEADILAELEYPYGTEFLVELFKKADACLTHYKNDVTWSFIESVAFQVTEDALEEPEIEMFGAIA